MSDGKRDIPELVHRIRSGDRVALGQGLTLLESARRSDRAARDELVTLAASGRPDVPTRRIAITGIPGSGKSTVIEKLGRALIARNHRVAVLAVDPSSERTGGSIMGDKTRMETLARLDAAFIRPSPTGGTLGGVTETTRESVLLCEAAGYDTVLVETVGVGQSETRVAELVDLVVLLVLSGTGDALQGIKRGVLEIADFVAVNKVDGDRRSAGVRAAAELRQALHLLRPDATHERFVRTLSATENEGVDNLCDDLLATHDRITASGQLRERRVAQRTSWFASEIDRQLHHALESLPDYDRVLTELSGHVRAGRMEPAAAASELLSLLLRPDRDA